MSIMYLVDFDLLYHIRRVMSIGGNEKRSVLPLFPSLFCDDADFFGSDAGRLADNAENLRRLVRLQ